MKTTYTLSKRELEDIIIEHVIKETSYSGNADDLRLQFQVGTGQGDGGVAGVEVISDD